MSCDPECCDRDLSCRELASPPLADFMLDPEWVYLVTVNGRTFASDLHVTVDIDQIEAVTAPRAPGCYDLTRKPAEKLHSVGPGYHVMISEAFALGLAEASDAEPVTWSAWAEHDRRVGISDCRIGVTATGRPVAVDHACLSRLDSHYRLRAVRRHRLLVIVRDATVCGVIAGTNLGDLSPIHHAIIAQLTDSRGKQFLHRYPGSF